ncbi:Ribonuclease_H-like superfamily [Hexamita inflata]|uniref:Ribonuclease H-like superfamily n=1 Tax=Hexamita inflata TaxID=28002 RepID=A0AA86QWN3_9EUKA|nr:Ribonuclease H-like superfamily [Hexamita inflata]
MWQERGYTNITTFLEYCSVILVSECPVERTFSVMGNIIGSRRYKLSPEMLHNTYMVKDYAYEQYSLIAAREEEAPQKSNPKAALKLLQPRK